MDGTGESGTGNDTLNQTGRRIIVQDNAYDSLPATIFRILASFLTFQPKTTRARRLTLKQEHVNVNAVASNRESLAIPHTARTYSQRAKQCDRYSLCRVGQAMATIYARTGAWAGTVAGATMPLTRKKTRPVTQQPWPWPSPSPLQQVLPLALPWLLRASRGLQPGQCLITRAHARSAAAIHDTHRTTAVCARVRVVCCGCVRVRVCAHACARMCIHARECVWARACAIYIVRHTQGILTWERSWIATPRRGTINCIYLAIALTQWLVRPGKRPHLRRHM